MASSIKMNLAQAKAVVSLLSSVPAKAYAIAQPDDDTDVVVVVEDGAEDNGWVVGPDGFVGHFSPAARRMLGLPELHRDVFGILRRGPGPEKA